MATLLDTKPPAAPVAMTRESFAMAGRRLRRLRRGPGRLVGIIMNPLVSLIVLGYIFQESLSVSGAGSYQEYIFAGVAAQVALAGIGPTAIAVAMDLRGGLVDRFRSLPISRSSVLVGHTLGDLVVGLMGLAVVVACGLVFGWRPHAGVLSVLAGFAVLAIFMYVMLWVGVVVGMLSRNMETINVVAGLVTVLFTFLSNAFQSVDRFPGWMQPFAQWNPVSAVATTLRELWGNNPLAAGAGSPGDNVSYVLVISLSAVLAVTTLLSLRWYRTAASGPAM